MLLCVLLARKPAKEVVVAGFNRLCLFHIIITLAKFAEFYKENKDVLPRACHADLKDLVRSIDQRGILKFRNNVVGHLYEEKTKKPLTLAEVASRVELITQGDLQGFFLWVNDGKANPYPTTVISVVERVRDLIRDENQFSNTDLV